MTNDVDQGGEAPCWAHFVEDLEQHASPREIVGSNAILYSDAGSSASASTEQISASTE